MGSFRFRKSIKLAPGLRLNLGKKSIGISAGVRGARYSINTAGKRTTSVGLPGTGLSYRATSGGRRRRSANPDTFEAVTETVAPSPTRLTASAVGWITLLIFVVAIITGSSHGAGTLAGIGIVAYVGLRMVRPVLDPMLTSLATAVNRWTTR
jgi:hypothetical protein